MDGWMDRQCVLLVITNPRVASWYYYYVIWYYMLYKHTFTVDLLRKCLGGPDMKNRSVGNPLDELILFSLETA